MTDAAPRGACLRLSNAAREELTSWARAARPAEACGLLIGRRATKRVLVEHVRLARNLDTTSGGDRFEVHPVDHIAIDVEARELGLEIVGSWHSHPNGAAVPSARDRASAIEGWSHVIVGVDERGACEVRSWRFDGERFVEETIEAE